MTAKIIQIALTVVDGCSVLYALDESGAVWFRRYDFHDNWKWVKAPPITAKFIDKDHKP